MKFALCNEVLQPMPFEQQCKTAAALGYDGLEVAPFTLAEDPMRMSDAQAVQFRKTANDHGLQICGLHWLLVAPAGLSIVSSDAGRARPHGGRDAAADRAVRPDGRQLPGARLAQAALGAAGRKPRAGAGARDRMLCAGGADGARLAASPIA